MSDKISSLYEINFNRIYEYFSQLDRQGPGSPDITAKALSFVDNLSDKSAIADIGCGTGGQTMELANLISGKITGVDLSPDFIKIFNQNVKKLNLDNRVKGVVESMDKLSFQDRELDLIWSEGSIYNIGFERGLKEWRRFLKDGGYIVVSEASWFTDSRPHEIEKFWMDAYTGIDTIPKKVNQMQKAGYLPIATFVLPEECWIKNYHQPQKSIQLDFLKKYKGDREVEQFIEYQRYEAEVYLKYKDYYGYVFYIGRKLGV